MASDKMLGSFDQKSAPEDNDLLVEYDASASKVKNVKFGGVWNWIVKKLTSAVINELQTSSKNVVGAINELNSKIISGVINKNQDNTIVFPKTSGCLLLLYHPYWNNGIYTFSPYPNSDVTSVQTVIKADIASITLKGLTLTISANECQYSYFAICCDFYD